MKKYLFFGMIGAMALTFNACSSDDVVENPTFDGKSVKTEFALNLPGKIGTRQVKSTTQGDGSFRGIDADKFKLFAMNAARVADANPVLESTPLLSPITLGGFDAFDHQAAQDKWYYDIQVPVGTNAFLVYAAATSAGDEAVNGVLTMEEGDTPQGITFQLESVNDGIEISEAGATLLAALNGLLEVEGKANALAENAVKWNELKEDPTADEEDYANQYYYDLLQTFTSLKAGSKTSVLAFLKQLQAACAVPTGADDGLDVALDAAIGALIANDGADLGDDFTADANIPDGAAVLTFEDGAFKFVENSFANSEYTWGPNDYAYPAELWYRVNTGIRVDDELQSQNVGNDDWATFIENNYDAANTAVKASSQSIALVNPLQYAVGNFETQIKFANENMIKTTVTKLVQAVDETGAPIFDDNNEPVYVPAENGEQVTETVPVASLQLTGILVGDQKSVDWQALPLEDAAAKVIYDTDLIATTFSTAFAVASQTLVLETNQETVNIALEFQNNSEVDFTGVDKCIIPAGTKFYLIGKLDISEAGKNYTELTEGKEPAIFEQDYKTIAKFTINNLENNAYNVVPDLRIPKLELGLSVDLEWEKGYTFEIPIGEGAAEEETTTEP